MQGLTIYASMVFGAVRAKELAYDVPQAQGLGYLCTRARSASYVLVTYEGAAKAQVADRSSLMQKSLWLLRSMQ